jgi:hypothetical protein
MSAEPYPADEAGHGDVTRRREVPILSWEFTGSRVKGSVDAVTIFGAALSPAQAKAQYGGQITRHHLIDIQQLQALWNVIVSREDDDSMEALAHWAGKAGTLPAKPYNMQTTAAPGTLLKDVAWNPFNLIVGPLTNYRLGDPANDFDNIHFRSFPALSASDPNARAESLARQEFNAHVRRLREIYLLSKRYIEEVPPPQIVASLRTLLRSDTPASYPHLLGGASAGRSLLHPALWRDYTTVPNRWFLGNSDQKKFNNALGAHTLPYVSESYFPDLQHQPVSQFRKLSETIAAPPGGDPLARIPTSERGLFEPAACRRVLEAKLTAVRRFAAGGGVRVFICAPAENGLFRDIVTNVARALTEIALAEPAYKVTYVPMARPAFTACEVRIYPR